MLLLAFHISNIPQTLINEKEIELCDVIHDIIRNAIDDISCNIQTDSTLEFEDYHESDLPDPEVVEDKEIETSIENEESDNETDLYT